MHTHSLVLEVITGIHHYNTVGGRWEEAYKANYSHAEGRDGSKWSAVTARLAAVCTFTCTSCKIRYRRPEKEIEWGLMNLINWLLQHSLPITNTIIAFCCLVHLSHALFIIHIPSICSINCYIGVSGHCAIHSYIIYGNSEGQCIILSMYI